MTLLICHFSKKYPEFNLKETTVRCLKNECLAEIRISTSENAVTELPSKKCGQLTLLGKELEERVKAEFEITCGHRPISVHL